MTQKTGSKSALAAAFIVVAMASVFAADQPKSKDVQRQEMTSGMYASILPAVWNFQLALRSRGLGSALTTAHQADQAAMAEILGIPTTWHQTALIPVAYTTGGDFARSSRKPVADVIIWNRPGRDR